MSILKIVAIKDCAVQAFMRPSFIPATGGAVREFGDAVNDPKHEIYKHPGDYEMYYLGDFDEETGQFTCPKSPEILARAVDLKSS